MDNTAAIQEKYEAWLHNLKEIISINDNISEELANGLLSSLSQLSTGTSRELARARVGEFQSLKSSFNDENTRQSVLALVSDLLLANETDAGEVTQFCAPHHMAKYVNMQSRILPSMPPKISNVADTETFPMETSAFAPSGLTIDVGNSAFVDEPSTWKALEQISELADIVANVSKASMHDKALLNKINVVEENKANEIAKNITRNERRKELLDESADGLWSQQMLKLHGRVEETTADYALAELAVEKAREALEAAEKQKRHAESKLKKIRLASSEAKIKKKMVTDITNISLDVDYSNKERVDRKMAALNGFNQTYIALTDGLLAKQIQRDLPQLFSFLMSSIRTNDDAIGPIPGMHYLNSNVDDGGTMTPAATPSELFDETLPFIAVKSEDKVSKDMLLRIGLETIRLWRQMHGGMPAGVSIEQSLNACENALLGDLSNLPKSVDELDSNTESKQDPIYSKSTVFLYFNHVFHDTPEGHIESQMRVESVVSRVRRRMIRETIASENVRLRAASNDQLSAPEDAESGKNDINGMETNDRADAEAMDNNFYNASARKLVVLPCLGLISPPDWTLPLVHAPAYIRKLKNLAIEARRDDYLIPLEFDTDEYDDLNLMEEEELLLKDEKIELNLEKYREMEPGDFVQDALRLHPGDNKIASLYRKYCQDDEDNNSDVEANDRKELPSGKRRRKSKYFADGTAAHIGRRSRDDPTDNSNNSSSGQSASEDDSLPIGLNDGSDLGPANESKLVKLIYRIVSIVGSKKRIYSSCDIGVNNFNHWMKRREHKPKAGRRDGSGMWIKVGPTLQKRIVENLTQEEIDLLLSAGTIPDSLQRKVLATFPSGREKVSDVEDDESDVGDASAQDPSDLGPTNEKKLVRAIDRILRVVGTKKNIYTTCKIDPNHFTMWLKRRRISPRPNPYRDGSGLWASDIGPVLKNFLEANLDLEEIRSLVSIDAISRDLEVKVAKIFNSYRESSDGADSEYGDDGVTNHPSDLGPADETKLYRLVNKLIHITGAKRRIYDTMDINPNHFAAWLKHRRDHPVPSYKRDGNANWIPLVGPVLLKFMEANLMIDEINAILETNAALSNLDNNLRIKVLKLFNAYIPDSFERINSDMSVDEDELIRSNDNTDLGPANEKRMVTLVNRLISIAGTKKSIYDTCKINPSYFNMWLNKRLANPVVSGHEGGGAWLLVGTTIKKLILKHLSMEEVNELIDGPSNEIDNSGVIRSKVLKIFNLGGGSAPMMISDDSDTTSADVVAIKDENSEDHGLGPNNESKLLRIANAIMSITGTKKSVYDACGANQAAYTSWLMKRKSNPLTSTKYDGTWALVGEALRGILLSKFSTDELDVLLAKGSAAPEDLVDRVLTVFPNKGVRRLYVQENSDSDGEHFGTGRVNDPSGLGPSNEAALVSIIKKLIVIVGSKKRIYDTCNVGVNYFNTWLKNREAFPDRAMYEGRGQWIEVGPTLRKHIEAHLTIPEIKTILSWDHMGITRLDSALENKVFNMFSRNMEMDEKSDRASSNEDDFSVKHSPSIGCNSDESDLVEIANKVVYIIGTKKAVYETIGVGPDHFSKWLKKRNENSRPSPYESTGQWKEVASVFRPFLLQHFSKEELESIIRHSSVSSNMKEKLFSVFDSGGRYRSTAFSSANGSLDGKDSSDSHGESEDSDSSQIKQPRLSVSDGPTYSSVNTESDLGPADETNLIKLFERLTEHVTKKKICETCDIQSRYLYFWEVNRRKQVKPSPSEGRGRWTRIGPTLIKWIESKLTIPEIKFLYEEKTVGKGEFSMKDILFKLFGPKKQTSAAMHSSTTSESTDVKITDAKSEPTFCFGDSVTTIMGAGVIVDRSSSSNGVHFPISTERIAVKLNSGGIVQYLQADLIVKESFGSLVLRVIDRLLALVGAYKRISAEFDLHPSTLNGWIKLKRKSLSVPTIHTSVEAQVLNWISKLTFEEMDFFALDSPSNLQDYIPILIKLFGYKAIAWKEEWKTLLRVGDMVRTKYGVGKIITASHHTDSDVCVKLNGWNAVGYFNWGDVDVMTLAVLETRSIVQIAKHKTGDKYLNKFIEAQIAMYPNRLEASTPRRVDGCGDTGESDESRPLSAAFLSPLDAANFFDQIDYKTNAVFCRLVCDTLDHQNIQQMALTKFLQKCGFDIKQGQLSSWKIGSLSKSNRHLIMPGAVAWLLTEKSDLTSSQLIELNEAIQLASQNMDWFQSAFQNACKIVNAKIAEEGSPSDADDEGRITKRSRDDMEIEEMQADSTQKRFKRKLSNNEAEDYYMPSGSAGKHLGAYKFDVNSILADDYVLVNMVEKLIDIAGSQKRLYSAFNLRMSHFQQWLKLKRIDPSRSSKSGQWIQIGYIIREKVEQRLTQEEISFVLQMDKRSRAPEEIYYKLFADFDFDGVENSTGEMVASKTIDVANNLAVNRSTYDGVSPLDLIESLVQLAGSQKRLCDEINVPTTTFSAHLKQLRSTANGSLPSSSVESSFMNWISVLSTDQKKYLSTYGCEINDDSHDINQILETLFGTKFELQTSRLFSKSANAFEITQSDDDTNTKEDPSISPFEMFCRSSDIIRADKLILGSHSSFCEACKKPGSAGVLVYCGSCPCAFHPKCAEYSTQKRESTDIVPKAFYCARCYELGANENDVVTEEEKSSYSLCKQWILLFFKNSRRWTPALVVGKNRKHNAFLCEYWKGRKHQRMKINQWLDFSNCRILKPSQVCISTPGFGSDFAMSLKGRKRTPRLKKSITPIDSMSGTSNAEVIHDTYISADSFDAALCAAGVATRAVDIVMHSENTNAFACIRPPGHHAGRYGFTKGCLSTGFCLLNNAAISMIYARVKYGLKRVAVVDIDVHFGNGTAELLKDDPNAFFACTHMIHGEENKGFDRHDGHHNRQRGRAIADDNAEDFEFGFFPNNIGGTELSSDNFFSIGIYPIEKALPFGACTSTPHKIRKDNCGDRVDQEFGHDLFGPAGFRRAYSELIIPKLKVFQPELLIISAGFDGFITDPVGHNLGLEQTDYTWVTNELLGAMKSVNGRVISLMEGGYDVNPGTLGLATCVDTHVAALQSSDM